MDPWSNIEASAQDTEISEINKLENILDRIPENVRRIRELITRFEVCHFKYKQHLRNIRASIINLEPVIEPDIIGSNHISKGENAWIADKTGRSLLGQQYLWALNNWLIEKTNVKISDEHDSGLGLKVSGLLGDKTPDKERIVRLLIARLTYDWQAYEQLQTGGHLKDLEYQTCRMDICHYAFPSHIDIVIQSIGELKPGKNFEGCGSYDPEIRSFIKARYSEICRSLYPITQDKNDLIRNWLYLCLAKTIKEQTGLTEPLPVLDI